VRAASVAQFPNLLAKPYSPQPEVFNLIEDNKPWWGMRGEAIWGEGQRSIEGLSEESRFILNPFLLVAANAWTFTMWKPDKTTTEDLDNPKFPYNWLPSAIRLWPAKSMGEVVYPVSVFNDQMYEFRDKLKDQKIVPKFALVAYNARDFGYNWLWVNPKESSNIDCLHKMDEPVHIRQMIHCGGSCGYPGGCNNMSPSMPIIDEIAYGALPAKAYVELWKEKPSDVSQQPDMVFVINLE
jgi:hypothetical protein